jgi:hypothetical protein
MARDCGGGGGRRREREREKEMKLAGHRTRTEEAADQKRRKR